MDKVPIRYVIIGLAMMITQAIHKARTSSDTFNGTSGLSRGMSITGNIGYGKYNENNG